MNEFDDANEYQQPQPVHPLSDEALDENPVDAVRALRDLTVHKHQEAAVRDAVQQAEADFAASHQDYFDSLSYLRDVTAKSVRADFPDATDAQINAEIQRRELAFGAQTVAAGGNPAERAYRQARAAGFPSIQDEPLHISEVKTPKQADEFRARMNTEFNSVLDEIGVR